MVTVLLPPLFLPLAPANPDGTEVQDKEQEHTILSRVETALKENIGDYEMAPLAI